MTHLSLEGNVIIVVSQNNTSEKKDLLVSMYGMVFQAYIDKVWDYHCMYVDLLYYSYVVSLRIHGKMD